MKKTSIAISGIDFARASTLKIHDLYINESQIHIWKKRRLRCRRKNGTRRILIQNSSQKSLSTKFNTNSILLMASS
jgi:hypothetical protein